MRKKVTIMQKRGQIMWKFLKIIELFPWLFQTYKIHGYFLPRIQLLHDMFDLSLPFMDRYFFVQRSFSIVFFSPKFSNQALNQMKKTGYWQSEKQIPRPSPEDAWNAWRFKIVYEQKDVFWSLFWVNNFFKMIILFAIFASEDCYSISQWTERYTMKLFNEPNLFI